MVATFVGAADKQEPDRALALEQFFLQLPRLFPDAKDAWRADAAYALAEVKDPDLLAAQLKCDDGMKRAFIKSTMRRGMFRQLQLIAMVMEALAQLCL